MLELGIPNNRKFKENFEKYKQDTKNKDIRNEKYIFKNSVKYMFTSTIFFVLIVAITIIGIYDLLIVSKTLDYRIILYLGLMVYGIYGFLKIYSHKIIVENNNIIYKKQRRKLWDGKDMVGMESIPGVIGARKKVESSVRSF